MFKLNVFYGSEEFPESDPNLLPMGTGLCLRGQLTVGFDWKLVTYWTMGLWGFPLASVYLLGGVLFRLLSCGGRGYGWVHNSLMLPHCLIRGGVCIRR